VGDGPVGDEVTSTASDPHPLEVGDGATAHSSRRAWLRRLAVWRSPSDQPRWARPALLVVTALATFSYAWGISNFALEPFYAGAVRSMGSNWKDFFYGAVDPNGTVTLDKLPGAFWVQALFVRVFGFHFWSVALPQVIAGALTILVLFRVVRVLAGARAALVAALIVAATPVTALLNRGNVSDSFLVLLTVLAADATVRAATTGRRRSLLLAGLWVGLAFQTKMVQAWVIVPALLATYLVASPADLRRRVRDVVAALVVIVVVSLSWMTVVSLIPGHDRPYVDGTRDDSPFVQVFVYNGWARVGVHLDVSDASLTQQPFERVALDEGSLLGTYHIKASFNRLLVGPLGRDDAWLLPVALLSALGLVVERRSTPRSDRLRTGVILWGGWLVILWGFFSFGTYVNSYYTAALTPAAAALGAMGLDACWRHRATSVLSRVVLLVAVPLTTLYAAFLIPAHASVAWWLLPVAGVLCALAEGALVASLVPAWRTRVTRGPLALTFASLLFVPAATTGVVVAQGLGSFSTPYQSAKITAGTTTAPETFQSGGAKFTALFDAVPAGHILQVDDTSYVAGSLIMLTGREFLPIGGITGSNPSPSRDQLQHLIDSGQANDFFVPLHPGGSDPRLVWIRSHCQQLSTFPQGVGVEFALYRCTPQ
jgi:4-amino-4-deoxy-L-arabinose transferase-like glycosyltransferase